jgi:hypothetical protein
MVESGAVEGGSEPASRLGRMANPALPAAPTYDPQALAVLVAEGMTKPLDGVLHQPSLFRSQSNPNPQGQQKQ